MSPRVLQVENGDVVGICVSGGLDSKTVALRLRLAGVKAGGAAVVPGWWGDAMGAPGSTRGVPGASKEHQVVIQLVHQLVSSLSW